MDRRSSSPGAARNPTTTGNSRRWPTTPPPAPPPPPPLWTRNYDGARHAEDSAIALAPSPDSSMVFVTGTSRGRHDDYLTVAYDAANGSTVWVGRTGINGLENQAESIAASGDGSKVFVTGRTRDPATSVDIGTVAYDAH